tara:strand:- start:2617 stop:4443 length:1827 start_codon:yes stop_codon:yes gene_type:complete
MTKITSVDLSQDLSPQIYESSNGEYIEYGTDDWKNTYPLFLIDLYQNSSTHAAIINSAADMIAGKDIIAEEGTSPENLAILNEFINNPNSSESLHDIVKKLALDFKLQGGYCINVIFSHDRTRISEIRHVPVEKVRSGIPNVLGRVTEYYVSADWNDVHNNPPQAIPSFNSNDRTHPSQLIYTGLYSPNLNSMFLPDYVAGVNWCLVDKMVADYHLNNIQSGFSGSHVINFNNGTPTRQEQKQLENSIKKKLTGVNGEKLLMTFTDQDVNTPEIHTLSSGDNHEQFISLQELLTQNILTSHRVTSPMLVGIKSDNGFGSNANELNDAFEIYNNTVIAPFQAHIKKTLDKILSVNGISNDIEFVKNTPITSKFDAETLKSVMTTDEIREELGLPALESNEVVTEDDVAKTNEFNSESPLDAFLSNYGEDMPEGYEVLSEDAADDESEDFNFETELNVQQVNLARVGSAYPNRKSNQDKTSKQDDNKNIYRVRYKYTGNSNPEREFCKKMMSSNKLYRKEDIIAMGSQAVNPGWGKGGADTYSIWKFKGGGACKHKWYRVILVQEGSRPKNSDVVITSTAAKSRGVKLPRNAQQVSVAPSDMPNKGFINK